MKRALFVDRDGTLMVDVGYPKNPDDVVLVPGAAEALVELRTIGYSVIVVSNQSGVGRGLLTERDVWRVHERMESLLAARGAILDAAYYCLHAPDAGCSCRKPKPGLLERATREHGIDVTQSWLVGDKVSDVQAGRAAGCQALLLSPGASQGPHDGGVVSTWTEVVASVLRC